MYPSRVSSWAGVRVDSSPFPPCSNPSLPHRDGRGYLAPGKKVFPPEKQVKLNRGDVTNACVARRFLE